MKWIVSWWTLPYGNRWQMPQRAQCLHYHYYFHFYLGVLVVPAFVASCRESDWLICRLFRTDWGKTNASTPNFHLVNVWMGLKTKYAFCQWHYFLLLSLPSDISESSISEIITWIYQFVMLIFVWQFISHAPEETPRKKGKYWSSYSCWVLFLESLGGYGVLLCYMCIGGNCGQ